MSIFDEIEEVAKVADRYGDHKFNQRIRDLKDHISQVTEIEEVAKLADRYGDHKLNQKIRDLKDHISQLMMIRNYVRRMRIDISNETAIRTNHDPSQPLLRLQKLQGLLRLHKLQGPRKPE